MDKKNIDYFKIYDYLYKNGYHRAGKNHGSHYVDKICDAVEFRSILEIGCSQGIAVGKFLKRRKLAYGIDVSLDAIKQATGKKYNIPNCIQSSATSIPFVNNFVDAVFTCDVLEHLTEKDIQIATKEIYRVSKKYLFIVFDEKVEGNKSWINLGKERNPNLFENIKSLHMTIKSTTWWREKIEESGFKLIKKMYLEDIKKPPIWIFTK